MRMHMVAIVVLILWAGPATAQLQIRDADHFWRKRIVQRLDLSEKINRPLIQPESNYYQAEATGYAESDGIIRSLIHGLEAGEYVAYHPEDWEVAMTYEDVLARMREFEEAGGGFDFEEASEGAEEFPVDDPFADPFASPETAEDPFATPSDDEWGSSTGSSDPFEGEDAWETGFDTGESETPVNTEDELGGHAASSQMPDLLPYEESLHMVEDWVFDKNRSMMVQQVDYFEIIWTDPMEVLPEKVLARFLWKDVKERLDDTQWKGRFNDAENRSIAEAIELRLFHAYPISVGGANIRSLEEAEKRRLELIEFEHHLWSY